MSSIVFNGYEQKQIFGNCFQTHVHSSRGVIAAAFIIHLIYTLSLAYSQCVLVSLPSPVWGWWGIFYGLEGCEIHTFIHGSREKRYRLLFLYQWIPELYVFLLLGLNSTKSHTAHVNRDEYRTFHLLDK